MKHSRFPLSKTPPAAAAMVRAALVLLTFLLPGAASRAAGQDANLNYRLSVRDQIEISIFDEPDLGTTQRIDGQGQIRLAHVGTIDLSGKTVREAEQYVEQLYIRHRILRSPMATVRVLEYSPREVKVLGAVGSPGTIEFPKEVSTMDIVDAISRAGDFTPEAKRNSVRITRVGPDGRPMVYVVNVDEMIAGRRIDIARVNVIPGDTVFVP